MVPFTRVPPLQHHSTLFLCGVYGIHVWSGYLSHTFHQKVSTSTHFPLRVNPSLSSTNPQCFIALQQSSDNLVISSHHRFLVVYYFYQGQPLLVLGPSKNAIISHLIWILTMFILNFSYRYNTKSRSLIIAGISSLLFQQIFEQWETSLDRNSATYFFLMNFFQYALRPMFFLRIVPMLATCRNKWKNLKEEENQKAADKKNEWISNVLKVLFFYDMLRN